MSLSALTYAGLEEAINRYLALDPDARAAMARLHGRVIAFEVSGLEKTFYLIPSHARVQLLAHYEGDPDCRLRGTPLALARMKDQRASSGQLFTGEVEISGDTELAHQIGKILGGMEIDWEEQLSHYTGDLLAHHIGNLVRDVGQWGQKSLSTLSLDLQEYLQEELRLLPLRPEIESFLDTVDRTRDDVERLEARIRQLQAQLERHEDEA